MGGNGGVEEDSRTGNLLMALPLNQRTSASPQPLLL